MWRRAATGSVRNPYRGEVRRHLRDAGFTDVAVHPFVPGVLSRVAGRKPG